MSFQERRDERKAQLKNAALELFAINGYENTKVSNIVKAINVSQGTFYWYFASKEECAIEMLDEGRIQLIESIKTGYRTEAFEIGDAIHSTQNMFERIFNFAEENPYLMQIILRGIHSQPILQEKVDKIREEMEFAFTANIKRAQELKVLRINVDAEFLAMMVMSLLEGILSRWVFRKETNTRILKNIDIQQVIKETVEFEFYGLFGQQLKGDEIL